MFTMVELYVSYDPTADALYIRLREGKVADSVELSNNIIVDYDEEGKIIGIEILNFSKTRINLNEIVMKGIEVMLPRVQVEE